MASKAKSFRVDIPKQIIVLYSNVEATPAEKTLIEYYLSKGFMPKFEEKKKGEKVSDMRKALAKDKEALEKFNALYAEKGGFHNAMRFYAEWKKVNK